MIAKFDVFECCCTLADVIITVAIAVEVVVSLLLRLLLLMITKESEKQAGVYCTVQNSTSLSDDSAVHERIRLGSTLAFS